ncbi:hypothetical protein [Sphingobium bisphenolivorans]|uniref:hypothetical protein n=1 Tax=Sphingobium bisphenolivorans TaxID=1335760 RepID=UPI001269D04F|nr:hypothetical protein [Sphingobium bisphenolivorans]
MRNRTKLQVMGMSTALALSLASPALAQTISAGDGILITEIQIADTPQSFIQDQVLANALGKSQDVGIVSDNVPDRSDVQGFNKGDVRGAIIAAFNSSAQSIIGSFNLDQVPGLQFTTVGNKVAVEQDGLRNLADINQAAGNAGWAVVNQAGEDNATLIEQADTRAPGQRSLNRAYVGQVGSAVQSGALLYSNYGRIQQTHRSFDLTAGRFSGNNLANNATIQQGGFRDVSLREVPVQFNAVAARNDALIEQEGAENDAVIQQGAENPNTFAFEIGDAIGRNNRAIVRQVGYGNRGVILQEDDANAITHQYGSDNLAFTRQDGDVLDGGQYSLIEQGRLENGDLSGNFASVFQRGILQESTIRQNSSRNDAHVYQTAESGYARSTIEQSGGSGNYASVLQAAPVASIDLAVVSLIVQSGASNEAFVSQRTAGSYSNVAQNGDRNFAQVRQ